LLFDQNKEGGDPLYTKIRDFHDKEVKKRIEDLWFIFKPFADSNFKQAFRDNLISRFWEMYLGVMFLQESKKLIKSGNVGPDICVKESENEKIWIEAIAPSCGEGPDKVPAMRGSGWSPEEKILLRIRSAIEEKYNKYIFYIEREHILSTEPYIIAINSCKLDYTLLNSDPSYIIQAVFPIGQLSATFRSDTGEKIKEGYLYRPTIKKKNKSPVETDIFLHDKYKVISAVLYSEIWPYDHPTRLGDRIRLVHNPNAINPVESYWLSAGIEYYLVGDKINFKNWIANTM